MGAATFGIWGGRGGVDGVLVGLDFAHVGQRRAALKVATIGTFAVIGAVDTRLETFAVFFQAVGFLAVAALVVAGAVDTGVCTSDFGPERLRIINTKIMRYITHIYKDLLRYILGGVGCPGTMCHHVTWSHVGSDVGLGLGSPFEKERFRVHRSTRKRYYLRVAIENRRDGELSLALMGL